MRAAIEGEERSFRGKGAKSANKQHELCIIDNQQYPIPYNNIVSTEVNEICTRNLNGLRTRNGNVRARVRAAG